jgi:hypothetical protein
MCKVINDSKAGGHKTSLLFKLLIQIILIGGTNLADNQVLTQIRVV